MSSQNTSPESTDLTDLPAHLAPDLSQLTTAPAFAFAKLLQPQFVLVVVSALGIIWLGAHGSLRRPPSAAPAKLKKGQKKRPGEEKFTEGLAAMDAIRFPILLGVTLIGLYYLIQWLQDPVTLNQILRAYMSVMGVTGLSSLAGDALDILTSLIFPSMWVDRNGQVYHIDPDRRLQFVVDRESGQETVVKEKETPLPGVLSNLVLSKERSRLLWDLRDLLNQEWTVRLVVRDRSIGKVQVRLIDPLRCAIGAAITLAYHLTGGHALSNLVSVAMCYASFMMFSPTSFDIGTMVLASLFVYDIVMVFYTPYMITVAEKLDAPVKLVFNSAKGVGMLGLGDIILPGMMMALALRFDLYQYYQKQTRLEPVELASETASAVPGVTTTTTRTQYKRVKAPYVDPRGQWGNRFWTTKLGSLLPVPEAASAIAATAFPKPYFYASVVGYAAGMLATLTALLVFNHGQPALLYLVPGVTGSLWLTALLRGELKEMWSYTEDGSLDTEDVVVEVDAAGKVVKEKVKKASEGEAGRSDSEDSDEEAEKSGKGKGSREGPYRVFMLSVTAPRSGPVH
ncbi:hypothetical protein VTK56DRAFT_2950 [Thermocarpiscus australiensis]